MFNTKLTQLFSNKLPVTILAVMFFLTGCAHQGFIEQGTRFINNNQYEAAVEQFTLALNEKPDDVNTQNRLKTAKQALHNWALALTPKADDAFHANHLGKALLLYGKSAQITKDPHSVKRYKQIYTTLKNQSIIKANIAANKLGATNNILNHIDGISAVQNAPTVLQFSQSNPIFEIQQSSQQAATQYISGSQLIANPHLVELQHELQSRGHEQRKLKKKINKDRNKLATQQSLSSNLSSQLQRIKTSLSSGKLSQSQQSNYNHKASSLRSKLSTAKANNKSLEQSLNANQHSLEKYQASSHKIARELSITPAVIDVPIYSDYVYTQYKQLNQLTGTVFLTINNVTRTAAITVESEDISHPAHPVINLEENPMQLLFQKELTPQFNKARHGIIKRLISELVAEKKADYLHQAQNTNDLEKQLTLLVKHGLITHEVMSNKVAAQIQHKLTSEFGSNGEFNVSQLLQLYSF